MNGNYRILTESLFSQPRNTKYWLQKLEIWILQSSKFGRNRWNFWLSQLSKHQINIDCKMIKIGPRPNCTAKTKHKAVVIWNYNILTAKVLEKTTVKLWADFIIKFKTYRIFFSKNCLSGSCQLIYSGFQFIYILHSY